MTWGNVKRKNALAASRRSAEVRRRRFMAQARVAGELRRKNLSLAKIAQALQVSVGKAEKLVAAVGARLPANLFRCGHPKESGNLRPNGPGVVGCRICRNAQGLRDYYRKKGKTLCRLARSWPLQHEARA